MLTFKIKNQIKEAIAVYIYNIFRLHSFRFTSVFGNQKQNSQKYWQLRFVLYVSELFAYIDLCLYNKPNSRRKMHRVRWHAHADLQHKRPHERSYSGLHFRPFPNALVQVDISFSATKNKTRTKIHKLRFFLYVSEFFAYTDLCLYNNTQQPQNDAQGPMACTCGSSK